MPLRKSILVGLSALVLGSTGARASLVAVTSYDMNNGNGFTQFTGPTGGQNYFDFSYKVNGVPDPYASQNGSNNPIPTNLTPQVAPLTGGTGKLTDGVIPTVNYSLVTSANPQSGPTEYVGWKYQDPTITFHLTTGQSVGQIQLFVAANNSGGLVGAPGNVTLTTINALGISTLLPTSSYKETTASYMNSPSTDVITLSLNQALSSSLLFSLQLFRGPLEADGRQYYADHIQGYNPNDPFGPNTCVGFCDPDLLPDNSNAAFASGFRAQAAGGATGDLALGAGLEPWIMLSQVQFTAAVPEPSTWMLMIAGFAGLGFAAYRRKAKLALTMA